MEKPSNLFDMVGEILTASFRGIMGVIKTQLTLALITFVVLSLGFFFFDISYWGLIAFLIAVVDLIPIVGSGIVMIPWAFVLLLLGNTPLAVRLLILYVALFIARQILEPVINGKNIGVKPFYTLLSTVLAGVLFGPLGLLIGPVIAIVVKTILDISERKKR